MITKLSDEALTEALITLKKSMIEKDTAIMKTTLASGSISGTTTMKIEDLVTRALRETLDKRKGVEELKPLKSTMEAIEERLPEEVVIPKIELKADEILASKIVGSLKEGDFAVKTFKPEDWHENIRAFIPKVNEEYVIPKKQAVDILRAWALGDKTLMYGPTGAGKSSLAEQLCAHTCRPFVRINCTGDMDSSMVFGQLTAKDGSTIWVDGPVSEAVKYGAVFAWDEWDVTPPEISMGLQWLLEDEGKLFLKEKPGTSAEKFITPHSEFRIMAIGNTQGQGDMNGNFAGTNVQNSATLDRFGTTVFIDYLPESHETKMIKNAYSSMPAKMVDSIVKYGNLIRQAYTSGQLTLTMSPRSLLGVSKKVSFGCTVGQAIELVYINKLSDTNQKVAKELYRKVFGV